MRRGHGMAVRSRSSPTHGCASPTRRGPHAAPRCAICFAALGDAIARDLTPHQREVMLALALNDVPIDVLAARLDTTRGALYKALYDARQKLRAGLAARG